MASSHEPDSNLSAAPVNDSGELVAELFEVVEADVARVVVAAAAAPEAAAAVCWLDWAEVCSVGWVMVDSIGTVVVLTTTGAAVKAGCAAV